MRCAIGDRLIEQRERISNRALGRPRDHGQRIGLDFHALFLADLAQMFGQQSGVDAAQIEALTARAHRHRHFLDFGRREDEFHMLGRLFERLEQAVEGRLGQHVHFVDDVDLRARHHRTIAGVVDDLTNVVDAGVGSRVHLQHVDMARVDDGLAMNPERAHVDRRLVDGGMAVSGRQLVIESAGENARGCRLADAAHAGQQIGLMDAAEVEGVLERAHHRLLADEVREGRGAVFAGKNAIGRRGRLLHAEKRGASVLERWRRRVALVVHLRPQKRKARRHESPMALTHGPEALWPCAARLSER